jgi:hypothetical protein
MSKFPFDSGQIGKIIAYLKQLERWVGARKKRMALAA